MDVRKAAPDGIAGSSTHPGLGLSEFIFTHKQRLASKLGSVETFGQFDQRLVTIGSHFCDDVGNQIPHGILGNRPASQPLDKRGVGGVLVGENLHTL